MRVERLRRGPGKGLARGYTEHPRVRSQEQAELESSARAQEEAQRQAALQADIAALQYIESRPLATPETIGTLARILREILEKEDSPLSPP